MNWAIFGEEQDCYLCVRHLCSLHNHIVDLVKDPAEALVLGDQHPLVRLQLPDRDRRAPLLIFTLTVCFRISL